MKKLLFTFLFFFLSATALAEGQCTCGGEYKIVEPSFKVHGRLSLWNGNPTARIWIIGTKRMIGIREGASLPKNLEELIGNFDTEIYGDDAVCPLTQHKKGVMQIVCMNSASNLKTKQRKSMVTGLAKPDTISIENINQCKAIGIEPISLPISDMGGCFFWPSNNNSWSPDSMNVDVLKSRQTLFITDHDFKRAMINLSGNNQMLELLNGDDVPVSKKKGIRFQRIYCGNNVRVTLDCTVIGVGEIGDLGCEYTMYESTLTITKDKISCKIALQGQCGC